MPIWFYLTLISITAVAFAEIGQKLSLSSKRNLSSETVNVLVAVTQLSFSIIFFVVTGQSEGLAVGTNEVLLIMASGFLSFWFFKFLYSSYKGNSASISQVIYSFSVVISAFLGIIFFSETLTGFKFLGIGLVLAAVILVSFKRGERLSKYNALALASAVVYGFLTNIDKSLSITINVHLYQILGILSFLLFSALLAGKKIVTEARRIDKQTARTILLSAVGFTIFNKLTFMAYAAGGEVGRVDAVNNTSVLLIILLEIVLLKDRSNLKKKLLGAGLATVGVVILGFAV